MPLLAREALAVCATPPVAAQAALLGRPKAATNAGGPGCPEGRGTMRKSVAASVQQPPGKAAVGGAPVYGSPVTSCQVAPPLLVR